MLKFVVIGAIIIVLFFGFLNLRAIELERMCITYIAVGFQNDKCEGFNNNQPKEYNDKRRVIA